MGEGFNAPLETSLASLHSCKNVHLSCDSVCSTPSFAYVMEGDACPPCLCWDIFRWSIGTPADCNGADAHLLSMHFKGAINRRHLRLKHPVPSAPNHSALRSHHPRSGLGVQRLWPKTKLVPRQVLGPWVHLYSEQPTASWCMHIHENHPKQELLHAALSFHGLAFPADTFISILASINSSIVRKLMLLPCSPLASFRCILINQSAVSLASVTIDIT